MEITKQPKLRFSGVDIKTFDFKSSRNFNFEVDPTIEIEAKLVKNTHNNSEIRVWMRILAKADGYFNLAVVGIGNFDVLVDISEEDKQQLININTPPIMFPYIRALISTFTANCGDAVPLLVIPTHFFKGHLDGIEIE
jgi:preprotein translocase subunit SecB